MKILILICFTFYSFSLSKNIEVIDSLSSIAFNDIIKNKKSDFYPVIDEGPKYFYQNLISCIYENDKYIKGDTLHLIINKYSPNYSYLDDDFKREIIFSVTDVNSLKLYEYKYLDTININDLDYIQDSNQKFDKAVLPNKKSSFFKKYIEPIVITASGLITIILLLSVRSN